MRTLFPSLNTFSFIMTTIINDILLFLGVIFVIVATNKLFDALVANQIYRFAIVGIS